MSRKDLPTNDAFLAACVIKLRLPLWLEQPTNPSVGRSITFDDVCSCLVAAYRWSFIGQDWWLPGTTGGQRGAFPSHGSGARPLGSISALSIVRQPILPGSQQGPFFLLWSPLPWFQKKQLTALPAPTKF